MKWQKCESALLFPLGLFLLICLASPVSATTKKPCCMPTQVEFNMGTSTGVATEHGGTETNRLARVSADFPNHRIAYQDTKDNIKLLMFPKENIEYVIYGGKCIKQPLPVLSNMSSNCLPADAKYQGMFHFGLGKEILAVDCWGLSMTGPGYQFQVNILVTPDTCMPVTELTVGKQGGSDVMVAMGYFDAQVGIEDPHVFDIPDICKKAEVGKAQVHVKKSFLFHAYGGQHLDTN